MSVSDGIRLFLREITRIAMFYNEITGFNKVKKLEVIYFTKLYLAFKHKRYFTLVFRVRKTYSLCELTHASKQLILETSYFEHESCCANFLLIFLLNLIKFAPIIFDRLVSYHCDNVFQILRLKVNVSVLDSSFNLLSSIFPLRF